MPLYRNEMELMEIYRIIIDKDSYDQLVLNINNHLITNIYNKYYILIRRSKAQSEVKDFFNRKKNEFEFYNQINNFNYINHSNWSELWSKKIDYIEYQVHHFENKYPLIEQSINYYIGMAENAISYVAMINKKDEFLTISHIRILDKNFNNPQNIIIDFRSRDVSEYLKYRFLKNDYNYSEIENLLVGLNFNFSSFELLYGRLLYPSFYFDLYDEIIEGEVSEQKILELVSRASEYEDYVNNIYHIIYQIKKIPRVTWL